MNTNSTIPKSLVLVTVLLVSLTLTASSQASDFTAFMGKFTLTNQVVWGKTVLQPGDYTITIRSTSAPVLVRVADSNGRNVALFVSGIVQGKTSERSALLLHQKRGQLCIYSLALASIGKVLVYDPALAQQAVREARAPETVPVVLARR